MRSRLQLVLIALLLGAINAYAGRLERGFEALEVHNYFKAKKLFEKSMNRHVVGASFGLSLIYTNDKNPFHSLNKAYKYILISDSAYATLKQREKENLLDLQIDSTSIHQQKLIVSSLIYDQAKKENSIAGYQQFINLNPWAVEYQEATRRRNQLAFDSVRAVNTYQGYLDFIQAYPQAVQVEEAQARYDRLFFLSKTEEQSLVAYQTFLINHPQSPYATAAEDSIYAISTTEGTIAAYEKFIRRNPNNKNVNKAWQQIYDLYTDDYTPEAISEFILDYPNYPYRNSAFKDFELAQIEFVPFTKNKGGVAQWGYIDTLGNVRIEPQFAYATKFKEGLAVIGKNKQLGYVNKRGEVMIEPQFEEAFPFHNGFALAVKNELFGVINKKGSAVVDFKYQELGASISGLRLALDNDQYGYINSLGETVIEFEYEFAYDFKGSYALVENDTATGLIDIQGNQVIPAVFEQLYFLNSSVLRGKLQGKYGMIHILGDTLIPFQYDVLGELACNRIMAVEEDEYSYMNSKGATVIEQRFNYEPAALNYAEFQEGFAAYKNNKGNFGIIDTNGTRVFPAIFENIGAFDSTLTPVKRYGKWGYANGEVDLIIEYQFDYAWAFENGRAKVELDGKQGIIDLEGNVIIPIDYQKLVIRKDTLIQVTTIENKMGLLSFDHVKVLPLIFDAINEITPSVLAVKVDGKTGLYNTLDRMFFYTESGFVGALSRKSDLIDRGSETINEDE